MKKLFVFALVCSLLIACDKDSEKPTVCTNTGMVRWGGDPAADGLGWHIIDSVGGMKIYIPHNLSDAMKVDGQSVSVCLYETGEEFLCMCAVPLKKYHITSIRKN